MLQNCINMTELGLLGGAMGQIAVSIPVSL